MHDSARFAASQSRAQSGDVDSNGDLVDSLRRRLDEAIGTDADGEGELHRERVLQVAARAQGLDPGVRLVDGKPLYSAAWLDAPVTA